MTQPNKTIRVAIADDHPIFRDGLRGMIVKMKDPAIRYCGEAGDGAALLELLASREIDLVFLDVMMPVLDGPATAGRIAVQFPQVKVIVLSSLGELSVVSSMIDAGAHGYLLKTTTQGELKRAILRVMEGKMAFDSSFAEAVASETMRSAKPVLTPREHQIIRLVCEGRSNKEIGELLSISVRTVEGHRLHILEKIDAHHFMDVVRYAVRSGIYKL